jgi:hypothetical protein
MHLAELSQFAESIVSLLRRRKAHDGVRTPDITTEGGWSRVLGKEGNLLEMRLVEDL